MGTEACKGLHITVTCHACIHTETKISKKLEFGK